MISGDLVGRSAVEVFFVAVVVFDLIFNQKRYTIYDRRVNQKSIV